MLLLEHRIGRTRLRIRLGEQGLHRSLEAGIEIEGQAYGRLRCSEDFAEGVAAFHEKRKHKGMTIEEASAAMDDPLFFAAMLVSQGEVRKQTLDTYRAKLEICQAMGAPVELTSPEHPSGTDRVAEVARALPEVDVIVNVQGDEPEIEAEIIEKMAPAIIT